MLNVAAPARFRLLRRLAEGGMGVVYEAVDRERNTHVALKTVRNMTASSLARFKHEFRALQDVHHANLVTLGELISEGDQWFYTMEFIAGVDVLRYVRPEPAWRSSSIIAAGETTPPRFVPFAESKDADPRLFHEGRLRSALRQLVSALIALHEGGLVHRDVKPSNVIVTDAGRVVLVDFGLVLDMTDRSSIGARVLGTAAYMAPEQATLSEVGPEADVYAVGALLYEALTGTAPFQGSNVEVLLQKQQGEPPAPSSVAPGVPADLDGLCCALLRLDPKARPTASDVLRALGEGEGDERGSRPSHSASQPAHAPFVGRARELEQLREAYRATREGKPIAVVVHGESGMGKSSLVRHFTEALALEERDLLVLAGRCYERESIPYKAFDGVVDALTRFLARLPNAEAARYLPTRPAPLAQVFPVLRRVEAIAQFPRLTQQTFDPVETRSRAFAALRELLTRLADTRPLVVVIDDIQWADAESLTQLADVMNAPESPNLLFVTTQRPLRESSSISFAKRSLFRLAEALPGDVREIELGPMPDGEARELAGILLERTAHGSSVQAAQIATEAEGHPFFIDALVRHVALTGESLGILRLEDALASRIDQLDEPSHVLMSLLAVAGAPIPQDVLARAAAADSSDFNRRVSALRVAHLAQTTGRHGWDLIEPYHDRVRAAVLMQLRPTARAAYHRRVALALETEGSGDAEALAIHWRGANDPDRAATYALMAATSATQALAFDRAASLYAFVLRVRDLPSEDRRDIQEKLGEALANAGRGAAAAKAFEQASVGAKAADALELRRRSAEELFRSGHFDDALKAIQSVLASLELKLPATPWQALIYLVFWRMFLRLRGLRFHERDSSQLTPRELARIDICWSVAFGLSMVDHIRAAAFQVRHLRLALDAGEPHRVARALALEIAFLACCGGATWQLTTAVMKRAEELARRTDDAHARGLIHAMAGVAHYFAGRFREGLAFCDQAERRLPAQASGGAWEIDTVRVFALACLAHLGNLKELSARRPLYLREALDRGSVHGAVNVRLGYANLVWLADDDAAGARVEVKEAIAQWSRQGFHFEHYFELHGLTNIDLYCGQAREAHARLLERWRALERSMLPRVQIVRIGARDLRARSALALAESDETNRRALLRAADRDAGRLEQERMKWSTAMAKLIRAGVARVRREREERVVALLREAAAGFEEVCMALHVAATNACLGEILGGEEGRTLSDRAERWMISQEVKSPRKMTAMLAPGFSRLS